MASPPDKTPSEIPTLRGEQNVGDWIRGLNKALRAHGLQHYISTPSNLAKHVAAVHRRFCELQPAHFPTLGHYRMAASLRKYDLDDMGCPIDDTLATWIVINALEADYPDLHHHLAKYMAAGNLDWQALIEEIDAVAPEYEYVDDGTLEADPLLPSDGDNGGIVDQLE